MSSAVIREQCPMGDAIPLVPINFRTIGGFLGLATKHFDCLKDIRID
jgi:hypothetical protein